MQDPEETVKEELVETAENPGNVAETQQNPEVVTETKEAETTQEPEQPKQETEEEVKKDKPQAKTKAEKAEKVESPRTVKIESADERTLYVNLSGRAYEGKSIEVPSEDEGEIRNLLTSGGFLVK